MKKLFLATTTFVVLSAVSARGRGQGRAAGLHASSGARARLHLDRHVLGRQRRLRLGDARYDAALNASALGFIPGLAGTAVAGTAISASEKIDGVIGGVQTGYNYQFGAWVWGLE